MIAATIVAGLNSKVRNGEGKAFWCHFSYHDSYDFARLRSNVRWTQLSKGRLRAIVGRSYDVLSSSFDLQFDLHDR